jgi:signal transduction histidine kinase
VIRGAGDGQEETSHATDTDSPQMPGSGWSADGEYWRYLTVSETWHGQTVVLCAGIPAPGLGGLLRQFRLELWVRGFIVTAFILFALLFHRIVLLPFRAMRQRASTLVESGLLPEVPGQPTDDPEYVMSTFDVLVRRLIEEADTHRQSAAKSEKRARNVERFNEYMLSSMNTGVLILGRDGTILRANRASEHTLRAEISTMTGHHFRTAGLYPEMVAVIEEGLRYGQLYSRREMRIERDGTEGPLYLGVNTSLIRNEFDEVVGLSILMTDLTEIKRLYDELAENQRLADLGEMAAGLAHQLRNSMAAILGYGKLLQDMTGPDARSNNWIASVIGETKETAQMLDRFLSFARPLTGDRESVDLASVVAQAIEATEVLARDAGVRVALHADPANVLTHSVMGDALMLKQVFVNLIQNGIEATARGGKIAVTISPPIVASGEPSRAVLAASAVRVNGEVSNVHEREAIFRVEIADDGVGIPENDRTQIFRPFFTSKETGTGLGLPLAKKIAVFHGGNLTLERSGPDGSVFVVTLPAQRISGDSFREQELAETTRVLPESVPVSNH